MQAQLKQVTVWYGMPADIIRGPYFVHDTVNNERYVTMLQESHTQRR